MSVDSTSPAFSALTAATLADLWQRVSMRCEARLHQLELLVSHLFDRPLTADEVRHAQTYANELASRLGLLGVVSGASKLRRASQLLDRPAVQSMEPGQQARRGELAIQLATLTDEVRSNSEDAAADLQLLSRGPAAVLVVGAQGELTDALLWSAASSGLAVRHIKPHHLDRLTDLNPDAIIQVLDDADHIADVSKLLSDAMPATPLLALAPRLHAVEQVELASYAALVVPRRTHPEVVTEETQRLLRARDIQPTVALFGPGADALGAELAANGLLPTLVASGESLMDVVIEAKVRGVVCAPMPDGSVASALIRLLRSERRGRTIVIGCMASSEEQRTAALLAGADCFWTAGTAPATIAVELQSRLDRNAIIDASLTEIEDNSLVPWSVGAVLLQRLVNDGARAKSAVAFSVLHLREIPEIDDQLARSFRRGDVVTRRDPQTLVIALRGADRSTLTRRLQGTLESIHPGVSGVSGVRAAVMEYPTDARSAVQALERADSALERAEMLGGPSIVGIDWCPDFEAPPDVLILDSDELLAHTLVSALGRAGLDCVVLPVQASGGALPDSGINQVLPPRLAIVDVSAENASHLEELRHLRRLYPAESTKMIVTSSDISLALIDHAYGLEAFDVVEKPFNLPLLVRRIQRELS